MIYVKFNPENGFHRETCGFEEWEPRFDLGLCYGIKLCIARAVGYTVSLNPSFAAEDTRVYLCTEHFEQSRQREGVHETEIKTERKVNQR